MQNQIRHEYKVAQKLLRDQTIDDARSLGSGRSGRNHRHRHHHRSRREDGQGSQALTEENLEQVIADMEGSVVSSRHGKAPSRSGGAYQAPPSESGLSKPDLERRYTELPPYMSQLSRRPDFPPPVRAMSLPSMVDDNIDMNLAYGDLPPPLPSPAEQQQDLKALMAKFDTLMLEAQCIHHTATTIIASLQQNPDAMAAVALTLAEISKLVTKMGPSILGVLKASSPAIFALLASPQFLIAGGVAVGVTIVMFGGYKIIKKIQNDVAERPEAPRLEAPIAYEAAPEFDQVDGQEDFDGELSSIEIWRRGIAEVEAESVATSVDGEFITPAAARLQEHRIRTRAMEERVNEESESESEDLQSLRSSRRAPSKAASRAPSVAESSRTHSTAAKRRDNASKASARQAYAETINTESTTRSKKEKKPKKQSTLALMFKGRSEVRSERSLVNSTRHHHHHHPRMIEV